MKNTILSFCCLFLLSSCFKKESPYPFPDQGVISGGVKESVVEQGENYETEVYYSLTHGIVKTGDRTIWDLAFSCNPETHEVWMNGGNGVLLYPTDADQFSSILDEKGISSASWLYDSPKGNSGQSALGVLTPENHLNKAILIDIGQTQKYKLFIRNADANHYEIEFGYLDDTEGSVHILEKDTNFNFVYFSATKGIIQPEPPKHKWDLLFTRYRHIYEDFGGVEGNDFLYLVSGVLTNPYQTRTGKDLDKDYDFATFSKDDALNYELLTDRDVIGFEWKTVDINTSIYVTNPRKIYVIEDSRKNLWKLHFIDFHDENGIKGSPKFRYESLQ